MGRLGRVRTLKIGRKWQQVQRLHICISPTITHQPTHTHIARCGCRCLKGQGKRAERALSPAACLEAVGQIGDKRQATGTTMRENCDHSVTTTYQPPNREHGRVKGMGNVKTCGQFRLAASAQSWSAKIQPPICVILDILRSRSLLAKHGSPPTSSPPG